MFNPLKSIREISFALNVALLLLLFFAIRGCSDARLQSKLEVERCNAEKMAAIEEAKSKVSRAELEAELRRQEQLREEAERERDARKAAEAFASQAERDKRRLLRELNDIQNCGSVRAPAGLWQRMLDAESH